MKFVRSWLLLGILALFTLSGPVHSDVLPNFLREDRSLPAMLFENLADYPAFDFYLKYAVGRGNPYASPHLIPVRPGETLRRLEGRGRIGEVYLLAAPHGQPSPPVPDASTWSKIPEGCLQSAPLEGVYGGEDAVVTYRVRMEDDKLEVTMQPPLPWARSSLQRLPWIAVSLALCAALAWLGVRLARRLFPPKSASSRSVDV